MSPRPYRLGLREASVDQTRQRILDGAREVLATHDRFTVDAVAQQADVARMTVYNQFGSKAGLLDALFDELARRGGLVDLRGVFGAAAFETALDALITTFCRFWASDRVVLRRLRAMAALDAELGALVHVRDQGRRTAIRALLDRFGRAGGDAADVLYVLTSFEAFDALCGDEGPTHTVCALLIRAAHAALR